MLSKGYAFASFVLLALPIKFITITRNQFLKYYYLQKYVVKAK